MKVDRVYDKATGKTHVTVTTLISNQGPTVSEYDELPEIPATSVPTVDAMKYVGNQISDTGRYITTFMDEMLKLQQSHEDDFTYNGERPSVEVTTAILKSKDSTEILWGLSPNYTIIQVSLQAEAMLSENDVVAINDATNNVILGKFEASQFMGGLNYNSQKLAIDIPSDCESVTISSSTDITIFASILYIKR